MRTEIATDLPIYTTTGASRVLEVSIWTIRALVKRGVLPFTVTSAGDRLFRESDLLRLKRNAPRRKRVPAKNVVRADADVPMRGLVGSGGSLPRSVNAVVVARRQRVTRNSLTAPKRLKRYCRDLVHEVMKGVNAKDTAKRPIGAWQPFSPRYDELCVGAAVLATATMRLETSTPTTSRVCLPKTCNQ
jgi:hypothetical protein